MKEKKINLEEQKNLQLDILKELKNICDSNNISYFLGGGTLLGAIRHKGYIPWDDDIDVMMPRKDYNKLLEIFNKQCNEQFKLLDYKNTEGYYYSFAKIVNNKTKLIENEYREINELGLYIDIFPIDYLPDDDKKIKKIFKKYKLLHRIMSIYACKDIEKTTKNKVKIFVKKIILSFISYKNKYKKILEKINNLSKKYVDTENVACINGRYFEKEIMPSSFISDSILADFEDGKFKIPVGYDSYLTKHYGDYMQLPPEEEREKTHDNITYWKQ